MNLIQAMHQLCLHKKAFFAFFLQGHVRCITHPSALEKRILADYERQFGLAYDPAERKKTTALEKADRRKTVTGFIANGVPAYDLQPFYERPHAWGEIFYDSRHVTFRGNECIATAMYEEFVKNIHACDSAAAQAEVMQDLRDTAHGIAAENIQVIDWLESVPKFPQLSQIGAIVMNCNPFTNGHKHIIAEALKQTDWLYVFMVQENLSVFNSLDRMNMLREGTAEFGGRVRIVPSGAFIISSFSFPEYFCKDSVDYSPDVSTEILIFGTTIAPALGITTRFFGEEPYCAVTRAYHAQLKELLPGCGVECREIPRLQQKGIAVSASRVRELLEQGDFAGIAELVPLSTLRCLKLLSRKKK
jgi:[citrate (pro-3S)-lyase] ligase